MISLLKNHDAKGSTNDTAMLYSSAALYQIPRGTLREMLDECNLDTFERYIRQVEEGIFAGPFTAARIEENLQLVVFSEDLDISQKQNIEILHNHPMREAIVAAYKQAGMYNLANKIETGQQSRSLVVSLAEKKNFYREVFDNMSETLTAIKDRLKTMRSMDSRIVSLIEKTERCQNEIYKLHGLTGRF